MEKELECKVFTDDFNALMDKAIEMGAKMIAHEIQDNILIESNDFDLINNSDYLRIRITEDIFNNKTKKYLTYKKRINDTNVRHYDEYTIE
ncbi:CYTH domain-containing protein, partial [Finegoldia magna]